MQRVALGGRHVAGHRHLVAILAAAHVDQVVGRRVERLSDARGGQLEADAAPLAARAQDGDVAAIGVDVHELRVERAHAQRGGHAARLEQDHRAAHVIGGGRHRPASRRAAGRPPRASRLELVGAHGVQPHGVQLLRRSRRRGTRAGAAGPRATPSRPGRTASGWLDSTQPSFSSTSGSGGSASPGGTASNGSASASGQRPRRGRGARGRSRAAERRPAGPPSSCTTCMGAMIRAKRLGSENERASAATVSTRRTQPERPRAPGQLGDQVAVGVQRGERVARGAARSSATRPVPQPRSSTGSPCSAASSLQTGRSAAYEAHSTSCHATAAGLQSDHRLARPRRASRSRSSISAV